MKHDPLNHKLLDEFPSIQNIYQNIKGGTFDLDTPSRYFYQEVFLPYIYDKIHVGDQKEVEHCFRFIEEMMSDEDERLNDLAMNGILCPMFEKLNSTMESLPLGIKSKEYYLNWLL